MIYKSISIRQIQHFIYCPHRWGLLEIDCAWAENFFVTKGNLMHKRVHDQKETYKYKDKTTYTALSVYNDSPEYNLYGVTDCLEVKNNKYCIVEYKPTKPKNKDYNYDDLMQVFAQKICVDYVFNCDCDAEIYYADVKKRVKLPLKENFLEYDSELKRIISEINELVQIGKIPPITKSQNCSGCSMKDICMPSAKKNYSVRDTIMSLGEVKL